MTFVGRTYLQTAEPHRDDVAAVGVIHGRTVPVDPPRPVVAVAGKWGRNILVRWPCGRLVVRPSRGLLRVPLHSVQDVAAAVRSFRFSYASEDELQEGLAAALAAAGLPVVREVRLNARDRIDLVVDRVGIEVKIAGKPDAVRRQLERYATHDELDALVLVTTRVRHQQPAEINGKPVVVVSLVGAGL